MCILAQMCARMHTCARARLRFGYFPFASVRIHTEDFYNKMKNAANAAFFYVQLTSLCVNVCCVRMVRVIGVIVISAQLFAKQQFNEKTIDFFPIIWYLIPISYLLFVECPLHELFGQIASESSIIVNGPSFNSDIFMSAPKIPLSTTEICFLQLLII